MAAPTNITPGTATAVGWGDYIQDVSEAAGPQYYVWYTYVGKVDETAVGVLAGAPASSNYDPQVRIYDNLTDANAATNHVIAANNAPLILPTSAGVTYYIRVHQFGAGVPDTPLTLSIKRAPTGTAPTGSILVNDETDGFPAAVFSGTTGQIFGYLPFPAGEGGAALPDGTVAVEDSANTVIRVFVVEDESYVPNAIVAFDLQTSGQINTNKSDRFYAGQNDTVIRFDSDGVIDGTWTLPTSDSLWGFAPSLDESILYYVQGPGTTGLAVKRWDLVNDVALSNLAAGIGGAGVRRDVLVMVDGSILVPYTTGVKRYSAAGAVLNTYTTATAGGVYDHIVLDLDPDNFIFIDQTSTYKHFYQIRASDGFVVYHTTIPRFNAGVGASGDGSPRFGASFSCPIIVIPTPITVPFTTSTPVDVIVVPPDGTQTCECVTPPTNPPPGTTLPPPITNPPPLEPFIGEQFYCTGGGLVPIQADFAPPEQWWGL